MYCYKCGKEIDNEAIVCPYCGCATKNYSPKSNYYTPYHSGNVDASPKSRLIALLLCIFLGFFGVHRYYIGKIGTGIIWTLTAGCIYIGWIVDIILIACGKMTDSNGDLILNWE